MKGEPLRVHRDARGWVVEPLAAGDFAAQRNAHLVLSEPGAVRGNHYHRLGTEVLTVAGPALVRTRQGGATVDTVVPEGDFYRFTLPPGVSHAVKNTGAAPILLISFNTAAHDPEHPDVVPDLLLE